MDVNGLVTKLTELVSVSPQVLKQVIKATSGGFQTPLDSSTELVSRLTSLVAGEVYPLTLLDRPKFPNIVYTLVSSQVGQFDGYLLTQSDRYVLEIRAATYAAMVTLVGSINSALKGSAYAIEVNDLAFDYEVDHHQYRCSMDIEFAYLSAASQVMPAAFVYGMDRIAGETMTDNFVQQRIQNTYSIVLVTASGNIDALLAAVMTKLLGWQQSTGDQYEYVSGSNVQGVAGLVVWREIYRDAQYIQQA